MVYIAIRSNNGEKKDNHSKYNKMHMITLIKPQNYKLILVVTKGNGIQFPGASDSLELTYNQSATPVSCMHLETR